MSDKHSSDIKTTIVAGAIAGCIAKFCVHPIDTIKAKVQVNRARIDNLKDFNQGIVWDIIKKTYSNEGIAGFFQGVGISALGSTIAFSAYMTAYQFCKRRLHNVEVYKCS
jgi:hypothetical protein